MSLSMSSQDKPVRVAYLGPQGTYGHQAAKRFISELNLGQSESIPCPTISDVYKNSSEYLVLPLQNVIHGSVIETIDSLLSPLSLSDSENDENQAGPSKPRHGEIRRRPMIIADLDLPIRHSLVVRKGVKMEDIRWVRSHEQALGQSSTFLKTHLPQAKLHSWPSTAGAALSLLPTARTRSQTNNDARSGDARQSFSGREDDVKSQGEEIGEGAAICSASVVSDHPDLEVLHEGTQSIENNFTRFLLLSRNPVTPNSKPSPSNSISPPDPPSLQTSNHHRRARSHFYALRHPSHLAQFPPSALPQIVGIHTRPYPVHPRASRKSRPDNKSELATRAKSGLAETQLDKDKDRDGLDLAAVNENDTIGIGNRGKEGLYRMMTLVEISAVEGVESIDGDSGPVSNHLAIGTGAAGYGGERVLYLGTAIHLS